MTPAELIATGLTHGLIHPGDENTPPFAVPLPGFHTTGMTDEQADELVGHSAQLLGEAITAQLETSYELIPRADAAALRQAASKPPEGTRIIAVFRTDKPTPLLEFSLGNTDRLTFSRLQLTNIANALTQD